MSNPGGSSTGGGIPAGGAADSAIVHLLRNSLSFAGWKERKLLAAALRPIYTAVSAEAELEAFEQGPWGQKFPMIGPTWRRAWERVPPSSPTRRPSSG